jgi:hypothetical protein
MQPIPKDNDEMIEEKHKLDQIMRPSTKHEFATLITALGMHCGMQNKNPDVIKSMMRDYWQDMSDYPKYLIEKACSKYRTLPEGNEFMPSSGKLISLVKAEFITLKRMEKRLNIILGNEVKKDPSKRENGMVSVDQILEKFQ